MNYNKVTLAGNLTRDPQIRFLQNERAVANFGIAINRRYKDQDGVQKEDTTFVEIEAWGRTAELVGQYLVKGKPVFIEGRLKLDMWEKEGQKHSKLKVVADSVQFLGTRDHAPGETGPEATTGHDNGAVRSDDDQSAQVPAANAPSRANSASAPSARSHSRPAPRTPQQAVAEGDDGPPF